MGIFVIIYNHGLIANKGLSIEILYQDDAILVINKPAGISTLPDGYNPTLPHIKSLLEYQAGRLWIVHRLDKETSGVLLLARSAEAHRSLNAQFEKHLVSKIYHALVLGNPVWQSKTIRLPLRPNGDRQHRTVIDQKAGKPAVTRLNVLERFGQYTLMEAMPQTGRTHQIRVHLASQGLSVAGDKLYAPWAARNDKTCHSPLDHNPLAALTDRINLHAFLLEINHPLTGEKLKFTAPYPAELAAVLEKLRSIALGR